MPNVDLRKKFDLAGEKIFEAGVDHCVLYKISSGAYGTGVVWNGITSITESPSGAEPNAQYADNIKYANLFSAEEFGGTIEAFTYPDEFAECDGSVAMTTVSGSSLTKLDAYVGQQNRVPFGLVYRTKIGNDNDGVDHGFKLHFVYGATVTPSEKAYETINDSPEALTFSWEFTTIPVNVTGMNPTSYVVVNCPKEGSPDYTSGHFAELLDYVYGKDGESSTADKNPTLPTPDQIRNILSTGSPTV